MLVAEASASDRIKVSSFLNHDVSLHDIADFLPMLPFSSHCTIFLWLYTLRCEETWMSILVE